MKLDAHDMHILSILQADNRCKSEILADRVGLSTTACRRRVIRLRSEGVIEADVSIVSPKAVGRNVQMLVLVTLEREREDIIDKFKKSIRQTPEAINGFYVTGDADFVLYISARNMEDYEQFTRRFFYQNSDIKSFKTMVVIDRVKAGFALPIHPDSGE